MDKLSQPEEQAMQVFWEVGEANVKAVLERLVAPQPPYTTLASTVKNLEKKGFLNSRLLGNMYVYQPAISEESYKRNFMGEFIRNYFDNSYKEVVNFFVNEQQLSKEELQEIIRLIEKSNKAR
ncbi:BlaI/MecI/CopY family transcriptional regulator [Flavihumibacter petaseus]|uniref:BlaI family transcriptional regulator n=1 Tax=Flavihumibacter petaseus NBRC 106054 TaxID=1220578 RepID=A0A0E9MZ95_9BACT|nr:BlaI/MecI/CopY family transcriptional regulator [Flavihumibacter petaseus]GAO42929.1 BlaI family transcriptional regulator [Flavihumibacter petaseus NBRC 106054]